MNNDEIKKIMDEIIKCNILPMDKLRYITNLIITNERKVVLIYNDDEKTTVEKNNNVWKIKNG